MEANTLGGALELEHRQIDGGIEAYLAGLDGPAGADATPVAASGTTDPAPLLAALAGLRRHIYLEEQFLFPPLKAAGLMGPIFVMLREHGALWDSMDAVASLLADGADTDARRSACTDLLALLDAHNSKEEPIIYSQADALLSEEAGGALEDFLARGTTPEGWVASAAHR